MDKEQYLSVYRHSLAHILAKAVIELYGKDVQYAIGPQIADGCYYDFVLPVAITKDDFKTIEDKMHEIIRRKEDWTRKEILVLAISLAGGLSVEFMPEILSGFPETLRSIFSSGITTGGLLAIFSNLLIRIKE